jgi:hypothetical protein
VDRKELIERTGEIAAEDNMVDALLLIAELLWDIDQTLARIERRS